MTTLDQHISQAIGAFDTHREQQWRDQNPIVDSAHRSAMEQASHYFRIQLGILSTDYQVDTIAAREVLDPNQTVAQWMKGFRQYVLPIVLQHGLPDWNNR